MRLATAMVSLSIVARGVSLSNFRDRNAQSGSYKKGDGFVLIGAA